jgi:hypothetical protein
MNVYSVHDSIRVLGYIRAYSESHAISLWKRTYGVQPMYATLVTVQEYVKSLAV